MQRGGTHSRSLKIRCGHGHYAVGHVAMKPSRGMTKFGSVTSDWRIRRKGLKWRTNRLWRRCRQMTRRIRRNGGLWWLRSDFMYWQWQGRW